MTTPSPAALAASPIAWISPPDRQLDRNGPLGVPFTPFERVWLDEPIIELFGRLVARNPDHLALDDGVERLTRGQVWAALCGLGSSLAKLARDKPGPIAVLLPHGARYWVGMLGCLYAGRACLLLDRSTPGERNAEIIADARPAAIVTDADGARSLLALPAAIPVALVAPAPDAGGGPREPAGRLEPDAPAFILYTSGSTGRPKGIVNSQRTALYRGMLFINAAHLNESDRIAGVTAVTNHAAMTLGPFISGATSHPIDLRQVGFARLLGRLRERRITVLHTTPSLLRALARLDGARAAFAGMRAIRLGGEPLLHADWRRLVDVLPPDCCLLNTFNATEAPLTQWFVPRACSPPGSRVATGYPTEASAILGAAGKPCRAGEEGELVVRSRYVALGEWRNGGLVRDRMPADPECPATRIYRTGDIVRQGADGLVVMVGRKDQRVKIGGQRVEPVEVEALLRSSPGVLDAVVLPRRNGDETRLAAFVVPAAFGDAGLADRLHARLGAALPAYMRPSTLTLLEAMPMLPSGKIDAQALLARNDRAASATPGLALDAAPSERAREMVARAWRQVLDRPSLERGLPFAKANGDSLRLLQFVFHLEQQCGGFLPLAAFSAELTPRGFARVLDRVLPDVPASERSPAAGDLDTGNNSAGSPRLELELVRALEVAYRSGAAPAPMAHARPYQWANACHDLFEAGRLAVLEHGLRHLHAVYPDVEYLRTLALLFDSVPCRLPPPLPFADDPSADVQIIERPGSDAVLLCFCALQGTLGLPLSFMHSWHGRLPVSLVYLKDFLNLSGAAGFPSLGPDRESSVAGLRRLVARLGARRIFTLGVSSGGFAALYYGFRLGAMGALSLGGATDLTVAFNQRIGNASACSRAIIEAAPDYGQRIGAMYAAGRHAPRVLAAFNSGNDVDRAQAEQLLGLPGVELVAVEGYSHHNVVESLVRERRYMSIAERLIGAATTATRPPRPVA
jgi:acyl-coenzyme A synthetase/AMP-(fatty) acid ligase